MPSKRTVVALSAAALIVLASGFFLLQIGSGGTKGSGVGTQTRSQGSQSSSVGTQSSSGGTQINNQSKFTFLAYPGETQLIQQYGEAGDLIILRGNGTSGGCPDASGAVQLKAEFPNLLVVQLYQKLAQIQKCAQALPSQVDYIGYDFEPWPGYTPEWTTNQSQVANLLDQARAVAHEYGKKLIFTPSYVAPDEAPPLQGSWDYGALASHVDALDLQIQSFASNIQKFKSIVGTVEGEIKSEAPGTLFFVEISLKITNVQASLNAYNSIATDNVTGIILWHDPSEVAECGAFLQELR